MKNYYDELEVSKTASKEVIEKVYKVLAKKYHPDTTQETDKQSAEEKFKIISEAYEILSDDEKRKKYDLELEQSNPIVSYEEYISVVNQRDSLNNQFNNLKNELYQFKNSNTNNYNNNTNYSSYNQVNSNYTNNSNSYNANTTNYTNSSRRYKYYNTATGRPISAFTYYKYKIKEFFSKISFIVLVITALILFINSCTNLNLFSLFF